MPSWMMQLYLTMLGCCCGDRDKAAPPPHDIDFWERSYDEMPWAEEETDPDEWPDEGFGWMRRQDNYWEML